MYVSLMMRMRTMKRLPKYLTDSQYSAYIHAVEQGPYRDQLIIKLMSEMGMRASEVVNLEVQHINFEEQYVLIEQGKGHKDRIVPLIDQNIVMLFRIVIGERKKGPFLFNSRGNPITRNGIYYIVRKYNTESLKLSPKELHPHTLRHTFAVRYLRRGGNIRVLQKLMGHSDIRTTMIYLDLLPEELFMDMKKVLNRV